MSSRWFNARPGRRRPAENVAELLGGPLGQGPGIDALIARYKDEDRPDCARGRPPPSSSKPNSAAVRHPPLQTDHAPCNAIAARTRSALSTSRAPQGGANRPRNPLSTHLAAKSPRRRSKRHPPRRVTVPASDIWRHGVSLAPHELPSALPRIAAGHLHEDTKAFLECNLYRRILSRVSRIGNALTLGMLKSGAQKSGPPLTINPTR
jgi:hypothetical protein